jgi:hypothetical protein
MITQVNQFLTSTYRWTKNVTDLRKKNADLPEDTAALLRRFRETDQAEFHALLLALKEKRWPYRAIGDAFGVTRAAVRAWYVTAGQDPFNFARAEVMVDHVPDLPPTARGSGVRAKRLIPDVPAEDQERIRDLTARAQVVKRWTPADSPAREAARELEELLFFYAKERHVPVVKLAKHAGVTRRAVAQRIEKQSARQASGV